MGPGPMPMPMPPQGAPEAPESAPQGGGVSQLISSAHENITKVMAMLQAKPDAAPPEAAEQLQAAIDALGSFVDAVSGDSDKGPAVGTPEQGSNPNAKPMV